MNLLKISLPLLVILAVYGCDTPNPKDKKNELSEKPEIGYSSMEIYCWGFQSDSLQTVSS